MLRSHRLERYMVSDDPDVETKAADVIELYLTPPPRATLDVKTGKCRASPSQVCLNPSLAPLFRQPSEPRNIVNSSNRLASRRGRALSLFSAWKSSQIRLQQTAIAPIGICN